MNLDSYIEQNNRDNAHEVGETTGPTDIKGSRFSEKKNAAGEFLFLMNDWSIVRTF